MKNAFILITALLILSISLSGCNGGPKELNLGANANASNIVPNLENYKKDNLDKEASGVGGAIATGLASAGEITAPYAAFIGNRMQKFLSCTADEGATSITHYYRDSDPIDHTILAIGEGDLDKIKKCVVKTATTFSVISPTSYGLYAHSYVIKNTATGNNFYITFLGTTNKGSYALCDKLPGCKKEEMFSVAVYTS